jgi:MOSC domain-containing protein YiiM
MDHVLGSPEGVGTLELVVCRPSVGERAILEEGTLDLEVGLVGDSWLTRGSRGTPDGSAHPDAQLTVMNARAATLVAGPIERWGLAGDQLYVDLDLSEERLPAGSRLAIGSAVIEITAKPHRGCAKFAERFGTEATRFFNTGLGLTLNLRGRNARILTPGKIRRGDSVHLLQDAN